MRYDSSSIKAVPDTERERKTEADTANTMVNVDRLQETRPEWWGNE